ncbi:nucleotide-binding alpha-beta plait domain-containing protein [Tanacetum coccineum]|uniref:Nucleotide-binding alpha-beta plait domain-containing protein n=1 Tax=Tanacetum coccineum TaxID=301880 RepID=A0ABQ5E9X3_9ASTR
MGVKGPVNSYVHAVKGGTPSVNVEAVSSPAMVLEDDCLNQQDLAHSLMGRVKELASLSNLKKVLANEGFDNIEIEYLGELWVLLKFASEESKNLFQENAGVGTWFSQLQQASMDFIIDGRITWVEIEGIPFKLWSENTLKRIASRWGVVLHVDDQEDGCLHRRRMCIKTKFDKNIFESFKIIFRGKIFWIRAKEALGWVPDLLEDNEEDYESDWESKEGDVKGDDVGLKSCSILGEDSDVEGVSETKFEAGSHNSNKEDVFGGQMDSPSDDPFKIYELLNKEKEDINKGPSHDSSLKYPPGFTPSVDMEEQNKKSGESEKVSGERSHKGLKKGPNEDIAESICSGHFKKSELPRTRGSILHLMEELVKVGQVMGYNMDGCTKNMEVIIQSQGVNDGYQ